MYVIIFNLMSLTIIKKVTKMMTFIAKEYSDSEPEDLMALIANLDFDADEGEEPEVSF